MPTRDRLNTPPEKRRAPRGSVVSNFRGRHTTESLQHMEALKAAWKTSDAETIRRALAECAAALAKATP